MNPDAPSFVPKIAPKKSSTPPAAAAAAAAVESVNVYLTGLHKLVTDEELKKLIVEATSFTPVRVEIIYIGPKSSGCAVVEMKTAAEASKTVPIIEGKQLRSQTFHATLTPFSQEEIRHPMHKNKQHQQQRLQYQEEIAYLQQQYIDGFTYIHEEIPVEVSVSIKMPPDFPFDVENGKLVFHVSFPLDYPINPCIITIHNKEIPQRLRTKIDASILKRAQTSYKSNPAMASGLLRWIKNNAEKLLVDKSLTEEHVSGLSFVVHSTNSGPAVGIEDDPSLQGGNLVQTTTDEKEEDNNESDEKEEEEKEEEADSGNAIRFPTTTAHKGTQIVAYNMRLTEIGILTCTSLSIICTCGRCKQQQELILKSGELQTTECEKCHALFSITYRPEMMHASSSIVGYVDNEGCKPLDILPSVFSATCINCSSTTTFTAFQFGKQHDFVCIQCHSHCGLFIERATFYAIKTTTTTIPTQTVPRTKKPKDPREAGIHVGTPLPQKGTCKHYKRSFRWLRFPCCGRAFPCDVCHDEVSDHSCGWATRMLCGFCSKEQPISSSKPCISCGASMTGGHGSHWDAGQGCRDKTKMSKKDSKKYSDSNKTHSTSKDSKKK